MTILIYVLGGLLGLAAVALLLFGVIWLVEWVRRLRADVAGFQEFLEAGAPLEHHALVDAFQQPEDTPRTHVSDAGGGVWAYTVREVGRLALESGRLVVEDPSQWMPGRDEPEPLELAVRPGVYTVRALIATAADQRVAALQVVFKNGLTARLAPAWTSSWRKAAPVRRELPFMGVDSAVAAVASLETARRLAALDAEVSANLVAPGPADGGNPYLTGDPGDLWRTVESRPTATPSDDAATSTDPARPCGAVACYAGLGDGAYPLLISYDAGDDPTSLYVDFGFLGSPERLSVQRTAARKRAMARKRRLMTDRQEAERDDYPEDSPR